MAVSPVSFSKTPQAKDDLFANSLTEDSLKAVFDVMGNDLGGAAKKIYSLDNGDDDRDLLTRDTARIAGSSNDLSSKGAKIWITDDGKVGYDAGALSARLQSLALGQSFEDSFTYAIQLGNGTISVAKVTIVIAGTNDGPQITSAAQVGAVNEDATASVSGQVTASDVDNGDHQLYSLPGGGAGTYGSFDLNAATGAWTYTLNNGAANVQALAQGENHLETFTVRVTDDFGASASQVVEVTVSGTNDGPQVTSGDQTGATKEDVVPGASGRVTASDVDNGDHLHFAVQGSGAGTFGSLAVNGTTGVWAYALDDGLAGVQALAQGESHIESFTVRVSDDFGAWVDQAVKVTVTGTNDGPVAVADTATDDENRSQLIDVLANDTDVDNGHVLNLVNVSVPSGNGSVSISGNQLEFDPGADFDHLNVGQTATVVVSYAMSDEHGAASSSNVTLTITGTNDGPVAVADAAAGSENQAQFIDLLANDTDVDNGHVFTLQNVSVPSGNGSVSISGNQLAFDPGADFDHLNVGQTATAVVSYAMSDEHGAASSSSATLTITGTNDGPVAAADTAAGAENEARIVDVLANDTDLDDGHTFTLRAVSVAAGNGSASISGNQLAFEPGADFDHLNVGQAATVVVSYVMSDEHGAASSSNATLTITGTNDGPVAVADAAAITENQALLVDVLANDTDLDNGHSFTLRAVSVAAGNGSVSISGNQLAFDPSADFDHLNVGQAASVAVSYAMTDEHGAASSSTASVVISGLNDSPVVAGALSSSTSEDAAPYSIDLLAGASDVDDGFVLGAAGITEAGGKGGWVIEGNVITINPDYFGDGLNDGEFEHLNFSYQVMDEHGASVEQSLSVAIEGITDAPSLTVVTSAGERVNEIVLSITSQPARSERVALTFTDVPQGARILDVATGQDVTAGLHDYLGTRQFKLVLAADTDQYDDLSISATGYRDDGSATAATVRSIDLAYDVVATSETLNFSSNNQNIWGDFPGYIEFHEYIPFVGGTPMVWDANTETWTDVASDYWRSGKFGLVDVQLDTNKIVAVAQGQAQGTLNVAKAIFDATAYAVDAAVQRVYDAAKTVFAGAEHAFWYVARGVDQAVKDVFKAAQDAYAWAQGVYNDAWYVFSVVAAGIYNTAAGAYQGFMDYYNSFHPDWRWLNDAAKLVADGLWAGAQWAYGEANKAWSSVKTWFDNTATAIYNEALRVYNEAAGAVEQAAINTFNAAKTAFAEAQRVYDEAKAGVFNEANKAYALIQKGVNDTLAAIGSKVDFNSQLTVEAEVFAKAGLQVDVVLDLGSVDTSIDYQLTSTTQYNKTTDMLAITPLMANMTTGATVAFDTISPNAKFFVALHYDAGADFDVLLDGHLRVEGTTLYDLTPGANAPINLGQTISPKTAVADIQSLLADAGLAALDLAGDMDVGKLVLVDFDSTKLEPFEVPFVGTLTEDVVSITLQFPTVDTEGSEAAFGAGHFEEGGLVAVDFSEITGAVLNLVNARLDYSPELREKIPGLGSLYDTQNFDQLVDQALKAFMGTLLDVLDGQSEEVPIFLIDATDETSSSLILANLWPDSTMTSTLNGNTASMGFFASYGESEPVIHINFDIDQAVALVVNEIVKAAINVASQGSTVSVLDAIPTINPLDLTLGLDTILKVLKFDKASRDLVGKFFDLNLNFQAADVDAHATTKFSQEFTLSVDDMSYLVTLEDGEQQVFTANGAGKLLITDASSHDLNGDGSVSYTLDIVPTAMFSNDTELGFGVGYTLDFMKGSLGAGIKLPLGELLGIDSDWLTVEIPLVDVALGPLLRVQGDLDVLDVDVFEARFGLDMGSDSFAGAVDVELVGVNNALV